MKGDNEDENILGRILIVIPALALQIFWIYILFGGLDRILNGHLINVISLIFAIPAVLFVLSLVSKRDESSYKLLWVIVILIIPVFGAIMYAFLGNKQTGTRIKKKMINSAGNFGLKDYAARMDRSEEVIREDRRLGQSFRHVFEVTRFPVLKNGTSKYYSFGQYMFADMCTDLKTAQKYIFIEYFIIEHGKFWDTIVDILEERASKGVDVRVIYDDLGSIATYSPADIRDLEKKGIRCIAFNPLLFITTQLNNRDHRKIMVIDGRIAYSGGVNLADEYINEKEVYGIWKDIGFRVTGEAAESYSYMFAEFWNAFSKDQIGKDEIMAPEIREAADMENGYILPYYDSPVRDEHVSNVLYTELLSLASDYVWFYTPYLMLGDALFDAFIRAAQRGVDVYTG